MLGDTYHGEIKFILVMRNTEAEALADMELVGGIMKQYAPHLLGLVHTKSVPGAEACNERTP